MPRREAFISPFLFALWSFLTGLWGHVDKRIATFSSSRGQSLIFYARGSRAGESIIYRGPRVKSFWLRPSHLPLSFLPAGKCTIVLKSIRRGRAPIKLGKHSNFKHYKETVFLFVLKPLVMGTMRWRYVRNWPKEPFKKYQKLTH